MKNLQDVIRLGSKLEILYVEDDKALLEETTTILAKIFKSVDTAQSGTEGLLKFTQRRYDFIITDIEMPDLNGLEMSQKIKEINPDIPIVIISAYSNSSYLIEAINIGINYYVLKPILLPQLLSTLNNVVDVIENRRIAVECHNREIEENIRVAKEKLFLSITKSSPNPIIVCDGRNVAFYNASFDLLFDERELQMLKEQDSQLLSFIERKMKVDQLLKDENEFVEELDFRTLEEGIAVKISLRTKLGVKVYLMTKNTLQVDDKTAMVMFTFNDITQLSFQNIQLKAYDKAVGNLTDDKYLSEIKNDQPDIINRTKF
jgi:CheY-like chemotaxis protein